MHTQTLLAWTPACHLPAKRAAVCLGCPLGPTDAPKWRQYPGCAAGLCQFPQRGGSREGGCRVGICVRGTDSLVLPQPEEVAQEAVEEPLVEPLLEPEGENYEEPPQVRACCRALQRAWAAGGHRCPEQSPEPACTHSPVALQAARRGAEAGTRVLCPTWALSPALSFPVPQEEYQEYEPEA